MRKYIFLSIFIASYTSSAQASEFNSWFIGLYNQLTEAINNAGNQQNPCPQIEHFKSNSEMIESICSINNTLNSNQLSEYIQKRGGKEILEKQGIDFDKYISNLTFFLEHNNKMPSFIDELGKDKWTYKEPSEQSFSKWNERLQKDSSFMSVHKITTTKGEVPFVAARHLYTLSTSQEIDQAKTELINHFDQIKPRSIVIEGYEVGQPMPCQYVLSKAIEPNEVIKSEADLAMKIAFNREIVIIPGDSQKVDDVDYKIASGLSENDLNKLKDELKIVDFLHSYYSNLKQRVENPITTTITQLKRQGVDLNADKVSSLYRRLNGRELPTDTAAIYEDFTPPKYLQNPRGTNLLVAKQDKLRNQSLVNAIQIGLTKYGTTMPIYGSGHLPEIAPSLKKAK